MKAMGSSPLYSSGTLRRVISINRDDERQASDIPDNACISHIWMAEQMAL
jgi:hypothetical protein